MSLNPSGGVAVFTDGSSNYRDRTGGWAYVILDVEEGMVHASGFVGDTTNNRMELLAPIQALVRLYSEVGSCDVLIYSDSEYVVYGAQDPSRARRKNRDLWQDLDEACSLHEYVEFEHVKGHANHLYNEMADQLAGDARRKGIT